MSETAAPEKVNVFQDDMHKMYFDMLSGLIVKRNEAVGRFNAASGDRQSLTEEIRENSTDPDIVAAREAYSKAYLTLMALVDPLVEETIATTAGNTEALKATVKELDGKVKPGVTFFKKSYGDDAAEFLPSQTRLNGAKVRSGAGGRRIRGFAIEITYDGDTTAYENFASAAKFLDIETPDLQSEFFKKAGTEDLKNVPDVVNMTMQITEVDEDDNETVKDAFIKAYRTEEAKAKAAAATKPAAPAESDEPESASVDEDELSEYV